MRTALLVFLVAASGCKRTIATCNKFADMMAQCDSSDLGTGDERTQAIDLARGFCVEAYRDDTSSVPAESKQLIVETYAGIRERAECVSHAKTCDDYKAWSKDK